MTTNLRFSCRRGAVFAVFLVMAGMLCGCRQPSAPAKSDQPEVQRTLTSAQDTSPTSLHEAEQAIDEPAIEGAATDEASTLAPIEWAAPKVTRDRLRHSVKEAVHYLARHIDDKGRFAYLTNTDPTVKLPTDYNIVRHAGTMYGMGMYLQRYDPNNSLVKDALVRAADFLKAQMAPVPGHDDLLPIWSRPEVTGGAYEPQAHVGGCALGLVSLATLETVAPGSTPMEDLRRLANYLVFMQNEDGGFAMAVEADAKKIQNPNPRFYPGEAALALGLLYEIDPDPKWLEASAKTLRWMANRKDEDGKPVFDHWFPLATAQAWPFLTQEQRDELRDDVLPATALLCEDFSTPQRTNLKDEKLLGCLTGDGLTCPTATRCEGLMGSLFYLPEDEVELRAKLRSQVEDSLLFLIRSQVPEGKYAGGIPFAAIRYPNDDSGPNRRFNARAGEIRIDYIHHAISGMMLYDDLFLTDPPRRPSLKVAR